ncbi:MAG: hypothetical protein KGV59_00310 [Tenacibaculum sp.]|nr:hypothetical protein [Tenacibaculum sp.]
MINLSKKSTVFLSYDINYKGLAQNKILQEEPIDEIDILVEGTGFKLFLANFFSKEIELSVEKLNKKSTNNYYILVNNQIRNIQKQIKSGLLLKEIKQDTIYLKLGSLQTKKIPVLPNLEIEYKSGYDIVEKPLIKPDSVTISGTELQLKNINSIRLERLVLQDVSNDINKKLPIVLPEKLNKVKICHSSVEISIKVNKFTEKEFEIPVHVKNIPKGSKLNIFPKKVKVFFKLQLEDFDKITKDSFEVYCDFNEAVKNKHPYLILKLKSKSDYILTSRIVPNKVDFLIHK